MSAPKLWRHVFGAQRGSLGTFSGQREGGELKDTESRYFDYPQQAADAAAWCGRESEAGREVYFCAHLLNARRRVKENAAPVIALWGDLDGAEIPNGSLKPTGVIESSPGHFHCYWRLTDAVPPGVAENLNRRLAGEIGADSSGFDLTQLLRIPGTVNHKYEERPAVALVDLDTERSYLPRELDEALPALEEPNQATVAGLEKATADAPPVALGAAALRAWRGEDPKLKDDGSIDRSKSLLKIGRVLYDGGANPPVLVPALAERDAALGWRKYADNRDGGDREYRRIVEKLEEAGRNGGTEIAFGGKKPGEQEEGREEREDRRNQADRLIGYALEDLGSEAGALFVDQHGAPHALVAGEPVPLNSRCYSWLRRLMWEEEQKAVNGEYLKTAAGTLAAQAEFSGDVRELHTRAAWLDGTLFYELRPGKVVRVGPGGWTFEASEATPVLFRRYPNLKPLPDPEPDGSLDSLAAVLGSLVNLKTERDRRLLTAYAVTVALPHVGRPILNASGPMGSGKTTAGRIIKRLWDPTAPETVRYDPRDFLQKALHAYILMLDNVSSLPDSASDTLCRLVTGEADSKRKLYTDEEDVIIELRRAPIINGINVPTDRADVLDRSLPVELERIPDKERRTEEELWAVFEREHPRILGAALDILSRAIARKPSLKLSRRPRLADWGEYAASVYEVLGWGAETFLTDWDEVVRAQNRSTLDGSPVAQAVIRFMEDRENFEGSSTELHKKLEGVAENIGVSIARDKAWPKSARWLWRRMQEVVPLLVAVGIETSRSESKQGTIITLRKTSTDDATNATTEENPIDKPETGGDTDTDDATSNATRASNATANATRNPADRAESGISGISGIRSGTFSEDVRKLFKNPPEWMKAQARICREKGSPKSLTEPLAAAVSAHLYGSPEHKEAVLPAVEAQFHPLDCECAECL